MKRETSLSVSELQERLSDSVKRINLRGSESQASASNSAQTSPTTEKTLKLVPPQNTMSAALFKFMNSGEIAGQASSTPSDTTKSFSSLSGSGTHSSNEISAIDSVDISIDIRKRDSDGKSRHNSIDTSSFRGKLVAQGTVLDKISHRDEFSHKYAIFEEIGRGGFSRVYRCQEKVSKRNFAVKIIDLRPLRLQQRFDPSRLRREVDIMTRLHHPNIVEFVESFETEEELLMVLEYCPGKELFDVILENKFDEETAKIVFAQISRALYYLHALNIIHRDIKPENILVLNQTDANGHLVVKLLDFGLSKSNAGSEAKTFVGTPCYLSPEVEYTSKGLGGTYGLPADCWSLGAVLYVMLVARFPEFQQNPITKKVELKLPADLWGHISSAAKDLVSKLMDTSQFTRLTTHDALLHHWLGVHRSTRTELKAIADNCRVLGQGLQDDLAVHEKKSIDASGNTITAGGFPIQPTEMVLRVRKGETSPRNAITENEDHLQLSPLFQLQQNVASCFADAHASYKDIPEVATQVRQGAVLCRRQYVESTKMLYKIDTTATMVLNMFPDLTLAVEAGEPRLASEFFKLVKGWVAELRAMVLSTQEANQASMAQIQTIVENSTLSLQNRVASKLPQQVKVPRKVLNHILQKQFGSGQLDFLSANSNTDDDVKLSGEQVMELFMGLFANPGGSRTPKSAQRQRSGSDIMNDTDDSYAEDIDNGDYHNGTSGTGVHEAIGFRGAPLSGAVETFVKSDLDFEEAGDRTSWNQQPSWRSKEQIDTFATKPIPRITIPSDSGGVVSGNVDASSQQVGLGSPSASSRLHEALRQLHQIDTILEQLSAFWANTELVLDVLTKKGQVVEQLIEFSQNPKLMNRFLERMEEYKQFWEKVRTLCKSYIIGAKGSDNGEDASPDDIYVSVSGKSGVDRSDSAGSNDPMRESL